MHRWAIAAGALCALFQLLLWTLDLTSTSQAPPERVELTQAKSIESILDCKKSTYLLDDISFYDSMTGLNCFMDDSEVVFVRVYSTAGSANTVIQDWKEVLGPEKQLLHTEKWFAIGPPKHLKIISEHYVTLSGPTQDAPAGADVTPENKMLGDCSFFLTGFVEDLAVDRSAYDSSIGYFEQMVPGSTSFIESIATDKVLDEIRTLQRQQHMELDQYLSGLSSVIKPFCSSALNSRS